jgi:hypothetical protein
MEQDCGALGRRVLGSLDVRACVIDIQSLSPRLQLHRLCLFHPLAVKSCLRSDDSALLPELLAACSVCPELLTLAIPTIVNCVTRFYGEDNGNDQHDTG